MPEIAIATPFDSAEIKQIVLAEMTKRLDQLCPLQGMKEYAGFDLDFQVNIRLRRVGEHIGKDTLAWGTVKAGEAGGVSETAAVSDDYTSKEPNVERDERDMPMTVEANDGKGGRVRKKVKVKK